MIGMLGALPLLTHAATACVHEVSMVFTESAPRDRFEIRNDSSAGQPIQRLTLDISSSAGRLIFDTIEGGTGVEVFQPFRVEPGEARLKGAPVVQDGSDRLTLVFTRFDPGQRFRFSIDVDDQLTASDLGQIRVSGREMEGAVLTAVFGPLGGAGTELQARVDGSNRALGKVACP
ncbi:hypothetical protein [Hydrogenophaga sp.]|uniref:hypothetical protein n=1 Tax=Hydrogenophaga sp. TaxID=1904254 RepID=UPI0025C01B7E|nr:hypothetical protein [Hydrogenophaga sp.]